VGGGGEETRVAKGVGGEPEIERNIRKVKKGGR
jgi:hypothetical protein